MLTKLADWINMNHMIVVTITQAKTDFYKFIEKVITGVEVIITKYGKPVAKLEKYK